MILNASESSARLFSESCEGVGVGGKTENGKIGGKETGCMGRQFQALGNKHCIESGKMWLSTLQVQLPWLVFHTHC
jgi:hypothetical protein